MSGVVYFVRAGENGPIKIGWTVSPISKRIAALQTGCSERLHLIKTIDAPSKAEEKKWHAALSDARLMGEWFRPDAEVIEAIRVGFVPELEVIRTKKVKKRPKSFANRSFVDWFSESGFRFQQECADWLGLHKSTVSRMLRDEHYVPDKLVALYIETRTGGKVPATSWRRVAA